MATSGSINFAVTRDTIIKEALQIQGTIGDNDTPTSGQYTSFAFTLNTMVKYWQSMGLNLFTLQRNYLFLQKNVNEYALGSSSIRFAKSIGQTTTSAAAASAASSIVTTDDLTGVLSDDDYIGVLTSDNTLHWSTLNGNVSSTTVALDTALDGAVASGAVVYYYTAANQSDRPMKIIQGVRRTSGNIDTPLWRLSRQEYVELTDKKTDGQPVNIYYDPQITNGNLFVWPEVDNESQYLVLWTQRTAEDFDASGDNPDFPQEWYMPLAWNLAYYTAHKQGVPQKKRVEIKQIADMMLEQAMSFDRESYTKFEPDLVGRA